MPPNAEQQVTTSEISMEITRSAPFVDGAKTFINGEVKEWTGKINDCFSPIIDPKTGSKTPIGRLAALTEKESVEAVEAAAKAWNKGTGEWPQMSLAGRIAVIEKYVATLAARRQEIVDILMWEICKNTADAESEFDRTMKFIATIIMEIKSQMKTGDEWTTVSGVMAKVRRGPIGVMLCLGPFNYPFNETYATLIPALLLGNTVVMKIPALGGLAHMLTIDALQQCLPAGVVNFVTGSGRVTMGPIMRTGLVDIFAFIGGSRAADALLKEHPAPHRVKVFLSLEGKNLGIVMPDCDLDRAAQQCMMGSTNYNGQRCTAIKMIFVHESIAETFLEKFIAQVASLKAGLPWESGIKITPLPEPNKPAYLKELIDDACSKGASVINASVGGGELVDSLMKPAILYPVTEEMRAWHEEQFGPVIPVGTYKDISEIHEYLYKMPYGQQAAIFTKSPSNAGALLDILSATVGRVNFNTQCSRSPDVFPFSARRSSGMGTLSVTEALETFSTKTVIACEAIPENVELAESVEAKFLEPVV